MFCLLLKCCFSRYLYFDLQRVILGLECSCEYVETSVILGLEL